MKLSESLRDSAQATEDYLARRPDGSMFPIMTLENQALIMRALATLLSGGIVFDPVIDDDDDQK